MDNAPNKPMTDSAIFAKFLRFGLLAWGGPVAQIAMVKRELVDEEKWLSPSRFGRLLAIYQVLPGPEAHELCVHLGMMKRGRLGGLLAGLGFMLPGLVLMLLLSWGYTRLDLGQPMIAALFLGVQVGVIALIFRAVHRIGEHILTDRWLWGIAAAAFAAAAVYVHFLILLPAAGLAYALARSGRTWAVGMVAMVAVAAAWATHDAPAISAAEATARASGTVSAWLLFLAGLKAGLLTFGGAYTAIPFVRDDTVGRGWIGDGQFLDGLALSGIIPAPLIIFATFVGYLAGGLPGALAMTAGIFVPAFAFSMLFYDRLERVVEDARLHHFLEGVAAGVVAMIAMTLVDLFRGVATSMPSRAVAAAIFMGALAMLYVWKSKLNVLGAVAGSAMIGIIAFS